MLLQQSIDRLNLMATMLDEVAAGTWKQTRGTGEREVVEKFNLRVWRCGSVACAVGHAMADGRFEGLDSLLTGEALAIPLVETQEGAEVIDWDATCVYFGIAPSEAYRLFSAEAYVSDDPTAVAQRVREFIQEHAG